MKGPGDQQSRTLKLGHTVLPFSLPMLFSNGFSMELSKVAVNIERDGEKEVEHNMSTLFLQLTQVLISPGLYLKKSRTLIKVELAWNNLRNNPEGL